MKTTLRRFKEDNDFDNVILVYEDGTQVRHTKASSLHPVHNNTIFKQQKTKSQLEQILDLDLDLKVLFLDQKLVPPLRGPSLTYKFSGDK